MSQRACNIERLCAWLKNAASAADKNSFNFLSNLYLEARINPLFRGVAPVVRAATFSHDV